MYNFQLYNSALYNGGAALGEFVPTEDFSFGTYGLQNDEIVIHNFEVVTPTREFSTVPVPGDDGMILLEDNWRENGLKLFGTVIGADKESLENKIHEMMRHLHVQGQLLYIKDGGNYKALKTTLRQATFDRDGGHITHVPFTLEFNGLKSFWESGVYVSEAYFGTTALEFIEQINNVGAVESNPIFIIVPSAASGVTGLSVKNNDTGEEIQISETISAGQVVRFDSERKVVEVDSTEVEFSGAFPKLRVGLNSFTINTTGAAINYDLTAKFKNSFLTP